MIKSKKILVVDDEQKIAEVIKSYLEHSGFEVYTAYNGKDAVLMNGKAEPDLIVLDLMLPDISGEEVCKKIRSQSKVPIIMLTAKVEEEDILKGLNIGADDYVTKPFSPKLLIARIIAVLRRTGDEPAYHESSISLNNGEIIIDDIKHEVKKDKTVISLTPNEYKILLTMARYPNKTFTREEIISVALGEDFEGFDRTVDTHIKNIRQKLEDDPKAPKYLLTVHGIGYRLGNSMGKDDRI